MLNMKISKMKMVLGFILFALVIKTKTKSYTSVTKKENRDYEQ